MENSAASKNAELRVRSRLAFQVRTGRALEIRRLAKKTSAVNGTIVNTLRARLGAFRLERASALSRRFMCRVFEIAGETRNPREDRGGGFQNRDVLRRAVGSAVSKRHRFAEGFHDGVARGAARRRGRRRRRSRLDTRTPRRGNRARRTLRCARGIRRRKRRRRRRRRPRG